MLWADATDSAKARTMERADHVREVLTGYKSGTAQIPREGEPRLEYHPQHSLRQRTAAKAAELGKGERTVRRWVAQYRESGEAGLMDYRSSQAGNALTGFDPRWIATAQTVLDEQTPKRRCPRRSSSTGSTRAPSASTARGGEASVACERVQRVG
ncbi:helix-turn-helix domain-containing protein [Microbacterium sp. NIBRBAC000506063]|uniref:helix-turn-helix domain-containing protein n=1 Tax=Microbacterium sp. NIBRBAC000506063 TaxID=2734618 RepID=UPI001BB679E2|nr:helix-turn-helix domain-containing protein [Microbacterium sp. NIBRBAC000506063]QTV80459.1 helix-turn-helix domain-containing protein [Microbacterium sp. NIBRBAC000506063]